MPKINWEELATEVGALSDRGEAGGSEYARKALAAVLGDAEIVSAVHTFISLEPGAELARNVLRLLRPGVAMQECHRVFRSSSEIGERQLAVALLVSAADRTALDWIDEFLDDPDSVIQSWGAKVLLELVFEECVEETEIETLLEKAEHHPNGDVREMARTARREYDLASKSE